MNRFAAEKLRDLADPRIPLPVRFALHERLREWAADLDRASQEIYDLADEIGTRVIDALEGDDDEEEDA